MVQRSAVIGRAPRVAEGAWKTALTEPLRVRDGTILKTLQDAADFVLERSKTEPGTWDVAAEALMVAANHPTRPNVSEATKAVKVALFLRHMLRRKAS
jgi:hypothetical protein